MKTAKILLDVAVIIISIAGIIIGFLALKGTIEE